MYAQQCISRSRKFLPKFNRWQYVMDLWGDVSFCVLHLTKKQQRKLNTTLASTVVVKTNKQQLKDKLISTKIKVVDACFSEKLYAMAGDAEQVKIIKQILGRRTRRRRRRFARWNSRLPFHRKRDIRFNCARICISRSVITATAIAGSHHDKWRQKCLSARKEWEFARWTWGLSQFPGKMQY